MNSSISPEHIRPVVTRRDILARAGHGFGALALASLLEANSRVNPLAAKAPHFAPKAKSVIFLFMVGGPSHVDTFDPKPALKKYEGQKPSQKVFLPVKGGFSPSPFRFEPHGQSGVV